MEGTVPIAMTYLGTSCGTSGDQHVGHERCRRRMRADIDDLALVRCTKRAVWKSPSLVDLEKSCHEQNQEWL